MLSSLVTGAFKEIENYITVCRGGFVEVQLWAGSHAFSTGAPRREKDRARAPWGVDTYASKSKQQSIRKAPTMVAYPPDSNDDTLHRSIWATMEVSVAENDVSMERQYLSKLLDGILHCRRPLYSSIAHLVLVPQGYKRRRFFGRRSFCMVPGIRDGTLSSGALAHARLSYERTHGALVVGARTRG